MSLSRANITIIQSGPGVTEKLDSRQACSTPPGGGVLHACLLSSFSVTHLQEELLLPYSNLYTSNWLWETSRVHGLAYPHPCRLSALYCPPTSHSHQVSE